MLTRLPPVLLAVASATLTACTGLDVSINSRGIGAARIGADGFSAVYEIDEIELEVQSFNRRGLRLIGIVVPTLPIPKAPARGGDFLITVKFRGEVHGLALDLGAVWLELPDGRKVVATGLHAESTAEVNAAPVTPHWPWNKIHVWARFDIKAPSTDAPFVLHVDGLTRDGEPVSIEPIQFDREWHVHCLFGMTDVLLGP